MNLQPNYGIQVSRGFRHKPGKRFINCLLQEWLTILTFLILLFKSIVLMGFVYSSDQSVIDIGKGIDNITFMPLCAVMLITIVSLSYLAKGKGRLWLLLILNFLVSVLFAFDAVYLRASGNFLSTQLLKQTGNLNNLWDSIFAMFRPCDVIFFVDIPILLAILILFRKLNYTSPLFRSLKARMIAFTITLILPVCFIIASYMALNVYGNNKNDYIFYTHWNPAQTICNTSPFGYHLYDVYIFFADNKPLNISEDKKQEIQSFLDSKNENLPDNKYKGMYKGKNLLVIQVESLENFVIGQSIDGQEITPTLNKLVKNSLYFDEYYTQINEGTSSDADLLTNTSVYPVRKGSTFFRFPYATYNSLPDLFNKKGYTTTAIHPDNGEYWNWLEALKNMGFQNCIDAKSFNMDEIIFLGLSDGSFLHQVKPMIIEQKQPFYTFMITMTSHSPFELPERHKQLKLPSYLADTKLGGFFQCIKYTDYYLGIFLDELDKAGILDNTVVVIQGDHTSVHKYFNDQIKSIEPSQDWWLDNDYRIPLIIYEKGQTPEKISTVGGQVDLMPTLAYLFGFDKEEYQHTVFGRNLLNTEKNFAMLSNGEFRGTLTQVEQEEMLKGLEYADIAIRSDFYKK